MYFLQEIKIGIIAKIECVKFMSISLLANFMNAKLNIENISPSHNWVRRRKEKPYEKKNSSRNAHRPYGCIFSSMWWRS